MATITITYTKPVDASVTPKNEICATFVPTNAAADNPVFAGYTAPDNYYDTNVPGYGYGVTPEDFFKSQVAHPGLVAALKAAMRTPGTAATWVGATAADEQYAAELKDTKALESQGFAIAISEE